MKQPYVLPSTQWAACDITSSSVHIICIGAIDCSHWRMMTFKLQQEQTHRKMWSEQTFGNEHYDLQCEHSLHVRLLFSMFPRCSPAPSLHFICQQDVPMKPQAYKHNHTIRLDHFRMLLHARRLRHINTKLIMWWRCSLGIRPAWPVVLYCLWPCHACLRRPHVIDVNTILLQRFCSCLK